MGIFNKNKQEDRKADTKELTYDPSDPSADINQRKDGESTQDYNERVPVNFQPMAPADTFDYLGRKKD